MQRVHMLQHGINRKEIVLIYYPVGGDSDEKGLTKKTCLTSIKLSVDWIVWIGLPACSILNYNYSTSYLACINVIDIQ